MLAGGLPWVFALAVVELVIGVWLDQRVAALCSGFWQLMRYSSLVIWLTGFPPFTRRFLLIGIDSLLLPLSVWLSFWLRLAHPFHPSFMPAGSWLVLASLLVGLPLYALTGQYKGLTRYEGSAAFYRLAVRNGLLILLLILSPDFDCRCRPAVVGSVVVIAKGFTGVLRFA